MYQKKINFRQKLYDLLKDNLEDQFDLFIVGSTQTRFSIKCSDLDLCLVIYDADGKVDDDYVHNKSLTIRKLIQIRNIVLENGMASKYELIPHAIVPILRFTDHTGQIRVDLNINRIVTIQNSFLLTCYK